MLGQAEVPETEGVAAPAPIQMDQATFMQILQMMVQAQQMQQQPSQGMPAQAPQGPDPRIAQALMG